MVNEFIQVSTTIEKREDAEKIAQALIEGRLSACVQIVGPINSIYRWKGKVERTEEWLCLIKTERNLYKQVERTIVKLHPYETPELVATPIIIGSGDYLHWLREELEPV